ncbi:hypothetical protein LTR92_011329 [Exophiala xenobiotica]|nr:hypothetical protein LTR92_011329 [Exophiala xenobiotica]
MVKELSTSRKRDQFKAALLWKFTKKEVEDALARIERLKLLINCALTNDLMTLSKAIHYDLGSVKHQVHGGRSRERFQGDMTNFATLARMDIPQHATRHRNWSPTADYFRRMRHSHGQILHRFQIQGVSRTYNELVASIPLPLVGVPLRPLSSLYRDDTHFIPQPNADRMSTECLVRNSFIRSEMLQAIRVFGYGACINGYNDGLKRRAGSPRK